MKAKSIATHTSHGATTEHKKCQICRNYLPAGLREMVWPLIDSDLWVAVVVVGETPGRAGEPRQDDAVQDKADHQTDNVAIEDLSMDVTEEPNPHIQGTQLAEEKGDNPIPVSVELH